MDFFLNVEQNRKIYFLFLLLMRLLCLCFGSLKSLVHVNMIRIFVLISLLGRSELPIDSHYLFDMIFVVVVYVDQFCHSYWIFDLILMSIIVILL